MNQELLFELDSFVRLYLVPTAWKVSGAVAIWVIGGWAIRLIRVAFGRFMRVRQVDETIARYLDASAAVVLKLLTLIAVLGVLGIETTSFAALLAAVGLAIGAAWSGLLANFAAGLFLLSFRPFKVGDSISAAGTAGTVREIGLFMTTIDTADHVLTYVPNNKLFMDNVQNFSANPTRRVDLTAQASTSTDLETTVNRLASIDQADTERARPAGSAGRDPHVQCDGPRAHRAAVLPERTLLAGVLRYEPRHQSGLHRRRRALSLGRARHVQLESLLRTRTIRSCEKAKIRRRLFSGAVRGFGLGAGASTGRRVRGRAGGGESGRQRLPRARAETRAGRRRIDRRVSFAALGSGVRNVDARVESRVLRAPAAGDVIQRQCRAAAGNARACSRICSAG